MAVDGLVDEFAQPWPDEAAHDSMQLQNSVVLPALEMQISGDSGFACFGEGDVMLF